MGADGSHGPRPFAQHRLSTTFVRVHADDWPAVKNGIKREFRGGRGASSRTFNVECPTPVVAYCIRAPNDYEARVMVLTNTWQEPLGAISDQSLAAEGFDTLAAFRRYWMLRERKRFQPTRMVFVYQVRPWEPDDLTELGVKLIDRLYGDFLEQL